MNVAEKKAHTEPVKSDGVARASFVKAKIKSLPIEQREDIVKEWIAIREVDDRAHRDHKHVRLESLVVLNKLKSLLMGSVPWFTLGDSVERLQPHYNFRCVHRRLG